MSFWTSFAKNVILKVLSDVGTSPGPDSDEGRRCLKCGRLAPVESIRDGVCLMCRLEQEHEEAHESRQRHDSGSQSDRASRGAINRLDEAYRTLDCKESDSDGEIKKKFRALIKECHVDSLPKDLPDYLVKAANQRFVEVQEAYDIIRDARKMP